MAEVILDKVHVVNRALVKLGEAPSYSTDDDTAIGAAVDLIWPGVEARFLAMCDFSFARKTYAMDEKAPPHNNGWPHGFVLPAERVGEPLAILTDVVRETYLREYMIEQGIVYANVKPLWARCRVMADPMFWDEGFREVFSIALAGALAVPIQQDGEAEKRFETQAFGDPREGGAGGLLGRLLALNKAASPPGRGFLNDDPLTNARFR